ncbi:hypothetical protein NFI96_010068 [Prochilodus magdalenae]|nr:hypothetical protein NFI96_010068 [Prochilodus magdalenae]
MRGVLINETYHISTSHCFPPVYLLLAVSVLMRFLYSASSQNIHFVKKTACFLQPHATLQVPTFRMLSSLARCASRGVLQVFKGASRTSRPFTMPRFGHQTLAAALPAVRGSPGVRQARTLDHERLLQVEWDDGSCSLYPFTWLRDNCQCPLCTLQSAQARSLLLTDLDVHTGVDQVQVTENNKVSIMWPDQHSSEFDPDWLKKRCFSPEARQARQEELFLNDSYGIAPSTSCVYYCDSFSKDPWRQASAVFFFSENNYNLVKLPLI